VLQKGKVHINLFNMLTRKKKGSTKLPSDIEKNNNSVNNNNLSTRDLKVASPSLKDMEFSWSENY
jgi:hypothetical protein